MPLPTSIKRLFSFTGFQQGQGGGAFPGTNVDADLDQTNNALNGVLTALASIVRPDGKLGNGVVTRGSLSADLLLGVGPAMPWDPTVSYTAQSDVVTRGSVVYLAVANSLGIDPATDLIDAFWLQTADLTQAVIVAPGSIGTGSFTDKAVTEPKLGDGAVSARTLRAGVVGRTNATVGLGIVPVGAEMDFAGFTTPAGWLFSAGQAVSRTTYADLFNALTLIVTNAATTTGDSRVKFSTADLSAVGIVGAVVEGPGIPAGTTVTDAVTGSIGLSAAANATGTVTLRLLPYGRGDGATTFNLPDRRGRVSAGRDNMGGSVAGRLAAVGDGLNLGVAVGSALATLTNANLPVNLPAGTVTVYHPAYPYATRAGAQSASNGAGGTTVSDLWVGNITVNSGPLGDRTYALSQPNPGGGAAFPVVQATAIVNRIIFAGV